MPFREGPNRTTIKFATMAKMPSLIYRACVTKGVPSNTRYVQEAICARLSKDLGIPLADLLNDLPPCRSNSNTLFDGTRKAVTPRQYAGSKNVEEVR